MKRDRTWCVHFSSGQIREEERQSPSHVARDKPRHYETATSGYLPALRSRTIRVTHAARTATRTTPAGGGGTLGGLYSIDAKEIVHGGDCDATQVGLHEEDHLDSGKGVHGKFVATKLKGNGWRRSTVEPDVRFKPDVGRKHWSYLLIYVDDQAALTDEMNKLFYGKFHRPFGTQAEVFHGNDVEQRGEQPNLPREDVHR